MRKLTMSVSNYYKCRTMNIMFCCWAQGDSGERCVHLSRRPSWFFISFVVKELPDELADGRVPALRQLLELQLFRLSDLQVKLRWTLQSHSCLLSLSKCRFHGICARYLPCTSGVKRYFQRAP